MNSLFIFLGAMNAVIGIGVGAFAAHGLKNMISPEMLNVVHTGASYQMWHALGLILLGILQQQHSDSKLINWAGLIMTSGIVLFSGSLYVLSLTQLKWVGIITPFGGISFLIAWLLIGIYAAKKRPRNRYN